MVRTSEPKADEVRRRGGLYNRFRRWSEMGVFDRVFSALVAEDGPPDTLMIDVVGERHAFE